ncbi:MAG TPA: FecR family protein [Steroidobacteraceae bacterium]|nr:FecR family protein [Steroidobacteraceae bacterium]
MERPGRSTFNTQIYQEACEWFIECRAGDLDNAARAEFDRWLRKSSEHQGAYLEIAAIWNEGPTLDSANRWDLDRLIAQAAEDPANIIAWERTRSTSHTSQSLPNSTEANERTTAAVLPARTGRRRPFAIAASILLATAALATYILTSSGVYATAVGEQRSLALSDGSTVQLNSLSKIRIRYGKHDRTVDLLQGQALFHVAKDTARPFIVGAGQTRVRAVGTQFDVYRKTDGTIVTVVEGRVAILKEGHPRGPKHEGKPGLQNLAPGAQVVDFAQQEGEGAIFLTAGEQITVSPKAARKTLHPNLAGATSWTQRQLVFDSASFADVAEEFNRYNKRQLVIDASALDTLHISGVFSSTDPASLIRFLRDRPGLRVTETPTEIRIEEDP